MIGIQSIGMCMNQRTQRVAADEVEGIGSAGCKVVGDVHGKPIVRMLASLPGIQGRGLWLGAMHGLAHRPRCGGARKDGEGLLGIGSVCQAIWPALGLVLCIGRAGDAGHVFQFFDHLLFMGCAGREGQKQRECEQQSCVLHKNSNSDKDKAQQRLLPPVAGNRTAACAVSCLCTSDDFDRSGNHFTEECPACRGESLSYKSITKIVAG